jgi:hypothetical protein
MDLQRLIKYIKASLSKIISLKQNPGDPDECIWVPFQINQNETCTKIHYD